MAEAVEDLIYLDKACDGNEAIGYIKLEPGMLVTFGPKQPEIHDGREGWPTEQAWPKA